MGALAKLLSYPEKILAAFFLRVLPGLLRTIILSICIILKHYQFVTTKSKYTAAIDQNSSKFRYTKKAGLGSGECSVCLSDFAEGEEGRELAECKHVFHRDCLEKWLKGYKPTCPLCRRAVVPEAVATEYRRRVQEEEEDKWIEEELALILLNALDGTHGRSCNGMFL